MLLESKEVKLKNIINKEGLTYFVSTCNTYDRGYETMVFISEYQPDTDNINKINLDLIDFRDIYQELHNNTEEAEKRHKIVVNMIRNFNSKDLKQILSIKLLEEK